MVRRALRSLPGLCLPFLIISCLGSSRREGVSPLPYELHAHTATALNDRIFVVGGYNSTDTDSRVHAYNPVTNQWSARADLRTGRLFHADAVVEGKLYVLGGCGDRETPFLSSVERYDPVTDRWTEATDIPTPRNRMPAVAWRGKIYVLGGHSANGNTDLVEIYDPSKNTWTTGPSLPVKTHGYGAVVLEDRIHVIGGIPPMHVRLEGSKWETRALAPGGLLFFGYGVVAGKLYAMGGHMGGAVRPRIRSAKGPLEGEVGYAPQSGPFRRGRIGGKALCDRRTEREFGVSLVFQRRPVRSRKGSLGITPPIGDIPILVENRSVGVRRFSIGGI